MAYADIAALQSDQDFYMRVAACASTQPDVTDPPPDWAAAHMWDVAGMPGFGDKYASALVAGVPRPGLDPSVISDADILSAVQAILAEP